LFTSLHTIPGWFTDIPLWPGRDGIHIPESGLAGRTFRSELVSESAGTAALDGAGVGGDSTGVADIHFMAAAGTTPTATPFTTGAISTGEARERESITVQARCPDLSMETVRRLEATLLNPTVRAVFARALSAATIMADKPGVIHPVEAPASVAEDFTVVAAEGLMAAVAGADNRSLGLGVACEI